MSVRLYRIAAVIFIFLFSLAFVSSCAPPVCTAPFDWFWFPFWFPFGFFGLALYCLPIIVAAVKRKKNIVGIVLLNILLGWTFIGWIVALVWAFSPDK